MAAMAKVTDPSAAGIQVIRKRSKIPGVMITQFTPDIPEDKTTPDFIRTPIPVTIQEGKLVVFKAVVKGDPKPEVTWKRAKEETLDVNKFRFKSDEATGEYVLEIPKVSSDEADTYKCFAANEYGRAVCTATLHVLEVGFKKKKAMQQLDIDLQKTDPAEFRTMLRKSKMGEKVETKKEEGGIDEKFWEVIMSTERKDYERVCAEYGVKDLRLILKKLEEKKQEREEEQSKYVDYISNLKHIDIKGDGSASFEFEMELKDPTSRILLYKDGVMVPYDIDSAKKHSLKCIGKKLVFNIGDLDADDAGLYQVDVEEVNVFSTDFKVPNVDFIVKIQEVKAKEREDALFECVLSHPQNKIKWMGKNNPLEDGEKYCITVTEDKLIHRLLVRDCSQLDKGIYAALAGIHTCSAWLVVEADNDPAQAGKKKARKTTQAGGAGVDLEKVAQEQGLLVQKERERLEAERQARREAQMEADRLAKLDADQEAETLAKLKAEKLLLEQNQRREDAEKRAEARKAQDDEAAEKKEEKLAKKKKKVEVTVDDVADHSGDTGAVIESEEIEEPEEKVKRPKRVVVEEEDTTTDPGVQFICGLSDFTAVIGQPAEIECKVNSEDCEGVWYRDGIKITANDDFIITKDGTTHKLVISSCTEEFSGKYRFEADGRKTEAMINVTDPPRFNADDLSAFMEPVIIKAGQHGIFKVPFMGLEPVKVQWYKEEAELYDDSSVTIEKSTGHSRLLLSRCQRKDTGEIKIKLKNEHGTVEALTQLIVLDKPTPPMGPLELEESSAVCINFKWRPPKDDGGSPVTSYMLERQQVGRNTWKKIGEIPAVPTYRDTDVEHGRKYCYRIRAVTAEGISEMMETDDIQAGTVAFAGPPNPPRVVSAFDNCINLSWAPPANTGGSRISGYNLEKRKKGSNLWSPVNPTDEPITEKKYAVTDVVAGVEYEFRVVAINFSGLGEYSNPSEFVFARDAKKPPGKVTDLKVTETSYTHFSLAWTKPENKAGLQDDAKGYYVEIRHAENPDWLRCNTIPFLLTSYSVKGLRSMGMYWVRVIATNEGGDSDPNDLDNYVLAMPPPVRPRFTDRKMKSFMVVRAGNAVRLTINFEASPWPEVIWMKDNGPVAKRITISNSDGSSQMLIPSSERSDSGVYSILVKNMAGQETFAVEIRVTDDPKPPGPVELEENVPGTVTVTWDPSPDEKRDDRLHYSVSKLDSTKGTWSIVADRLFNNKFTACNVMQGREYHFRVYSKNDIGMSAPAESPTWGTQKKKETFVVNMTRKKDCDLRCAPAFIVPLKFHTAPKGYECYMSCAVKGNPKPRITWYRNNISLNTNTNYLISNICGVCSMLILRVGPRDMGEYTICAENGLGRAECSTNLSVRD